MLVPTLLKKQTCCDDGAEQRNSSDERSTPPLTTTSSSCSSGGGGGRSESNEAAEKRQQRDQKHNMMQQATQTASLRPATAEHRLCRCWWTTTRTAVAFGVAIVLVCLTRVARGGDDRAEVNIRVSGACSPVYLSRRGIELSKYRPLVRFNPDKIQLVPKNPVIPGCVKIKAEGVEIIKPIRNLIAEVEMRIGGSPDPNNPTLPCNKKIDDKVNQCPCAKTEGSCVFCDFCRQMKTQTQSSRVSLTEALKKPDTAGAAGSAKAGKGEGIDDQCKCEVMQPGLYDIETEMCTPELDDAKEFIPPELQGNVLDKTPISMFITVYLMDMQAHANESYLSAFGRAILQRRMAQSTVACFLMGLDVQLAASRQQQQQQQHDEAQVAAGAEMAAESDSQQQAMALDALQQRMMEEAEGGGGVGIHAIRNVAGNVRHAPSE